MRFIIDAQLPAQVCQIFEQLGFDAIHVGDLPNGDETSDTEITAFADNSDRIVLTKDYDFYHSHMASGKPKKLFLITTGNIKNRQLFDLFRNNFLLISNAFEKNNFIEINNKGIIIH